MGTRAIKVTLSGWMLLALFTLACVMQPLGESYPEPEWVRSGSGAAETEQGRVFNGVGVATDIQSRVLLRATADNLAREELARVLEHFVRVLAQNERADHEHRGADDSAVDVSFHSLIQTSLRNATIVNHWTDSRDGRMYALCRLNLMAFKEDLAHDRQLEMALRNAMLDRADRVHAQMTAR